MPFKVLRMFGLVILLFLSSSHAANHALRFDGSNDVLRQLSCISVGQNAPFTIEMWVLARPTSDTWQVLANSSGFSMGIHSSGRLAFTVAVPGSSPAPGCCHLGTFSIYTRWYTVGTVVRDEWMHIAYVWDGSAPSVYFNGVLQAMTYDAQGSSFTCCSFGQDTDCYFHARLHATLDEIRVWNTARTQEEILAHMPLELQGTETGLLHYWPMNEGQGQMAADVRGSTDLQRGTSSGADQHDPQWVGANWIPTVSVLASPWSSVKSIYR